MGCRSVCLWMCWLTMGLAALAAGCEKTIVEQMVDVFEQMGETQAQGFEDMVDIVAEFPDACALAVRKSQEVQKATNSQVDALFRKYLELKRQMDQKQLNQAQDEGKRAFREAVGEMQATVSSNSQDLDMFMKSCPDEQVMTIGEMMAWFQGSLEERFFNEW
ncbi:MAG: hypothetical protein JXR96_02160 [Deltaproteobacteria bacterium]|nr:hypothetical protein [Deltaproteobacteria bacterium]